MQLYASCLQQGFKVNNQEIKEMEKDLDIEVILLWRSAFLNSLKLSSLIYFGDYGSLSSFIYSNNFH